MLLNHPQHERLCFTWSKMVFIKTKLNLVVDVQGIYIICYVQIMCIYIYIHMYMYTQIQELGMSSVRSATPLSTPSGAAIHKS